MNLFLSSENVGNYADTFLSMINGKRLAYIANAKDDVSDIERAMQVLKHKTQFESYGLEFSEIDLRNYFDSKVPKSILNRFDAVWCPGGNTFLLRSAMWLSGIDSVLKKRVETGTIVYGGSSAGSVVVGPTLHGTEHGDDPGMVEKIYNTEVVWDGLGIVNFVVIPHVGSDWFGAESQKMKQALIISDIPYREVQDGQVVIVISGKEVLLR